MTPPGGFLTILSLFTFAQLPATPPTPPTSVPATTAVPKTTPGPKSPAEVIADTRASIKQAEDVVAKLQLELDNPDGEYKSAETEFGALNQKLKDAKLLAGKLAKDGMADEAKAADETAVVLEKDWKLARERFDIAIQKRMGRREAVANLKERIAADQKRLSGLEETGTALETTPPPQPTPSDPRKPGVTPPGSPGTKPPPSKPTPPALGLPLTPELATIPGGAPTSPAASAPAEPADATDDDPLIRLARDRVAALRAAQFEAEEQLKTAQERVRMHERLMASAAKSQKLDQDALTQAEKAIGRADEILAAQPPVGDDERQRAEKSRADAVARVAESKERLTRTADRIDKANETLAEYMRDEVAAAAVAEKTKAAADAADAKLTAQLSPTSFRNLTKWVVERGPRLLLIVLLAILLHLSVRQFCRPVVRLAARNTGRGSATDRENRLDTLVGVFRYFAGLVVFGGALVSLLDVLGVPVGTIIGGAAVIGLAVAFGAQNLIRDYFTGFIMLLEDQYSVKDVVRIGSLSGQVEHISLRMTVLRDLEGVRHFIPHGSMTGVSNLTHTWSRALFDVPVAYKEDVDQVMEVLVQLGRDMRADPVFGREILEDPEMLGVDAFADSGVIVKFFMKTRPLQQWPVKREMLRRIKNRFDQMGIEIPFPHRTVYHRVAEGDAAGKLLKGLSLDRFAA